MNSYVHSSAGVAEPVERGVTPARRAGGVVFTLAGAGDDVPIRQLLRGQTMAGRIRLGIETEPSFFAAAALQGDEVEVLVARRPDARDVVGLGVRAIRHVWLDGRPTRVGHLSYLRVDETCRRRRDFLTAGYGLLRDLHERDRVPFYLTAVLQDNVAARRVLEANHRGMPIYTPLAEVTTFTLSTSHRRLRARGDKGGPLQEEEKASAMHCLRRNMHSLPLAPVDSEAAFEGPVRNGISWADFVAVRAGGRIAGIAALWDQRHVRQVRVMGYDSAVRRLRPFYNACQWLRRRPRLPGAGAVLGLAYVSRLAIDGDSTRAFLPLLGALAAKARTAGIDYLVVSLAAAHPFCPLIAPLAAHLTSSVLYAVRWPEDPPIAPAVGVPYVEAALL